MKSLFGTTGRGVRTLLLTACIAGIFISTLSGCFSRREIVRLPPTEPSVFPREKKPTLVLTFAGDIMAHDVNYNRPPYSHIYEGIRTYLWSDDLTFGNLEFPVHSGRPMSNYPSFNVHPPYVEAAIHAGFDVFSAANNHITDLGGEGVEKTKLFLEEMERIYGISYSGLCDPPGSGISVTSIDYRTWRIGFVAITEFLNSYYGAEGVFLLNYHDEEAKGEFLDLLDSVAGEYDLFIVSFHGGVEYSRVPADEKIAFFEEIHDRGVHIVWAHHPHVLQSWYLENGKTGSRLSLYSTGNFISGQTWRLDPLDTESVRIPTGESALFRVTVISSPDGPRITSVKPIPIANYKHPEQGMIVRHLEVLARDPFLEPVWRDFYLKRLWETKIITRDDGISNMLP
ncbi:MAG: CapA family protein [Spirochaetia bacterium]